MIKQYAVGSFLLLQCIILLSGVHSKIENTQMVNSSGITLPAKAMDDAGTLLVLPEEDDFFDGPTFTFRKEVAFRISFFARCRVSKKRVNFLRFGRKTSNPNFLRFGRAPNSPNFLRFGRAPNSPNFLRFGRQIGNPNFLRFGRKPYSNRQDRAVGNFLRFG
ncbi:FARP domain containing protein [Trichuris trichiura]|uniref:FARP domain containing protein n=1 Tax=Trichuris trichiura TaxID=36087 RepID=A0A077YXB1_TRITR|nr:FARP domain containing protein [Trichuris trichiura]